MVSSRKLKINEPGALEELWVLIDVFPEVSSLGRTDPHYIAYISFFIAFHVQSIREVKIGVLFCQIRL